MQPSVVIPRYPSWSASSPHERRATVLAAVLCLRFGLSPSEGRLLAQLMDHEVAQREELCAASALGTFKSLRVSMSTLRAKLLPHGVTIVNLPKMGYSLDRKSRDTIYAKLAEEGIVPERVRMSPQDQPELIEGN
jgi:hypothetical protein